MALLVQDSIFLAEKLRNEDPEQFQTLVRMHLSFVLDLNTDESDNSAEKKSRSIKWNLLPFNKKTKGAIKGSLDIPLSSHMVSQVHKLIQFLSQEDNISQEGIFRRSGKLTRQQELKSLLYQGAILNLDNSPFSVHDCASVLKNFLSELPESVLTEAHYPAYCQIAEYCDKNFNNEERLLKSLQLLLLLLPLENRNFIKDLFRLLNLAASHEDRNKMTADNLATLFTPHLLCPKKLSPEALHANSQVMSRVVAFMIRKGSKLFDIPAPLATDIRVYWEKKERRKLSPLKQMNESVCDSTAANTIFTFVDRERSAQANKVNPTETALAELYAHIQSLPESSKKRKLIKQFNKENGCGTPLRTSSHNKKHMRSRSLGDSIKRHLPVFNKASKPIQTTHTAAVYHMYPIPQNEARNGLGSLHSSKVLFHNTNTENNLPNCMPALKQSLLNDRSHLTCNHKKPDSLNNSFRKGDHLMTSKSCESLDDIVSNLKTKLQNSYSKSCEVLEANDDFEIPLKCTSIDDNDSQEELAVPLSGQHTTRFMYSKSADNLKDEENETMEQLELSQNKRILKRSSPSSTSFHENHSKSARLSEEVDTSVLNDKNIKNLKDWSVSNQVFMNSSYNNQNVQEPACICKVPDSSNYYDIQTSPLNLALMEKDNKIIVGSKTDIGLNNNFSGASKRNEFNVTKDHKSSYIVPSPTQLFVSEALNSFNIPISDHISFNNQTPNIKLQGSYSKAYAPPNTTNHFPKYNITHLRTPPNTSNSSIIHSLIPSCSKLNRGLGSNIFMATSTPAPRKRISSGCLLTPIVDKNNSMSPITRSAQRMPKAMQETMMTPRSRKPVISLSGTDLCQLASINNIDPPNNISLEEKSLGHCQIKHRTTTQENVVSTSSDRGKCNQLRPEQVKFLNSDKENISSTLSNSSLSSTFRDYLYSRSILTASPVDLSFSSRTDDYESTREEECSQNGRNDDKLINNIQLTESLLYCLDGNDPSTLSEDSMKEVRYELIVNENSSDSKDHSNFSKENSVWAKNSFESFPSESELNTEIHETAL